MSYSEISLDDWMRVLDPGLQESRSYSAYPLLEKSLSAWIRTEKCSFDFGRAVWETHLLGLGVGSLLNSARSSVKVKRILRTTMTSIKQLAKNVLNKNNNNK